MKKHIFAAAMTATVFSSLLFVGTAAHAEDPTPQNPCSDGVKSGDDDCTLQAGSFYNLDGTGMPYADVLINDSDGTNKPADACQIGMLDQQYGFAAVQHYSDGTSSFTLYLNQENTQTFTFDYIGCDQATHTVTVHVIPYVAPVAPTVTAYTPHKGFIEACEPSVTDGGSITDFLFGSFKQPSPDGMVVLKPGKCRKIRVHRHDIDWEAFRDSDGAFAKVGHVMHIQLPKGDHPPVGKHEVSTRNTTRWQLSRAV